MFGSRIDPVVKELNRKYARSVEKKIEIKDRMKNRNLPKNQNENLRVQLQEIEKEISSYEKKLRRRI